MLTVVVVGLVLSGCGKSYSSSSTTSPPTPSPTTSKAFCAQEQALKDSFDALIATTAVSEGTDTLKRRYDALTGNLASLGTAARAEFSTELDAVQSAVDQLNMAVSKAQSAGVAATATEFAAALGKLKTSGLALFAAMDRACGSPSTSS